VLLNFNPFADDILSVLLNPCRIISSIKELEHFGNILGLDAEYPATLLD
jgi:hypothetical protein